VLDGELGEFMEIGMKSQALMVKVEKTESAGVAGNGILHFEFTEGDGNVAKWDLMIVPCDEVLMGLEEECTDL
jgi:hypothetical protein